MNKPSRTDELVDHPEYNQSPRHFSNDLVTREDLIGNVNSRRHRARRLDHEEMDGIQESPPYELVTVHGKEKDEHSLPRNGAASTGGVSAAGSHEILSITSSDSPINRRGSWVTRAYQRTIEVLAKFLSFVGPGMMVSVAYIDPGNYATDVAAGATYRFKLLVMVMVSNIFAIFLQSLCIKMGSVTGLNLAEMIKANCPRWLNITLYILGEAAIIATDIAEVIGTAIALNLLFHIPLVAGCAISIADVLFILLFYHPNGSMRGLRAFEFFVALLVLGVVVCFCFQLSLIQNTSVGEVFRGYLPSRAIIESQGLYQSCGILGATVMPHSLYLGSGIVQSRLKDFDEKNNTGHAPPSQGDDDIEQKYQPSIVAVRSCMKYSIIELAISLFIFALFVNSAILIVAGASLSGTSAADADLFGIHDLLSRELASVAGTIFALALLLSGISAGIVCTIAGQMISEGQLSWSVKPWVRRLMTRSISITPSIIIAGAVGRDGLSTALEASQVALSVILPFVSAPLLYFTCRNKFMTMTSRTEDDSGDSQTVKMKNNWFTTACAIVIWGLIVIMNVALLVLLGLGVN
ncbi:hypothetical protein AAFC00_004790 [Neodothiora populina]|uniref:Uncharacterized protein n=1 Tax=Neodothiora populina TaxID=2781224 RepID=A0ABR3P366_9PEZI